MDARPQKITKEELEKLPKEAIVAFAARLALRVFPALATNSRFIKSKNFSKHLIKTEQLIHISILFSIGRIHKKEVQKLIDPYLAGGIAAIDAGGPSKYAGAAIYVADAVGNIAGNGEINYLDSIMSALKDAEYASGLAYQQTDSVIRDDYNYLLNWKQNSFEYLTDFYIRDIWLGKKPKKWYEVEEKFQKILKDLNLYEIYERYESGGAAYIDLPFDDNQTKQQKDIEPESKNKSEETELDIKDSDNGINLKNILRDAKKKSKKNDLDFSAKPPKSKSSFETESFSELNQMDFKAPDEFISEAPPAEPVVEELIEEEPASEDVAGEEVLQEEEEELGESGEREKEKESPVKINVPPKPPISIISGDTNPTLDVKKHAGVMAEILEHFKNERGQFVGIFGQWGRGKTYFWEQIEKTIDKDQFETETFHAWKYQDTPASWAYLYEILADKYFNKPKRLFKSGWSKYWFRRFRLGIKRGQWTKPLLMLIGAIVLNIFDFGSGKNGINWNEYFVWLMPILPLLTFLYEKQKKDFSTKAIDIFQNISKKVSFEKHMGAQAEIQKEMIKLLQVWFPSKKNKDGKRIITKRLLLFVDDIDRCEEERIIQIVDALRVMLENKEIVKRMIVVAAVDEGILGRAIFNKYHNLIEKSCSDEELEIKLKERVREQFDKLFITGIKLAPLSNKELQDYFNVLTVDRGAVNPEDIRDSIKIEEKTEVSEIVKSSENIEIRAANFEDNNLEKDFANPDTDTKPVVDVSSNVTKPEEPESKKEENKEINKYELQQYEKELLDELIKFIPKATPRQIRIWYYRYLLAIKLIRSADKTGVEKEFEFSEEAYNDSFVIALLLIEYGLYRQLENMKTDRSKIIGQKDIVHISALDGKCNLEIKADKLNMIFNILEVVIAY